MDSVKHTSVYFGELILGMFIIRETHKALLSGQGPSCWADRKIRLTMLRQSSLRQKTNFPRVKMELHSRPRSTYG